MQQVVENPNITKTLKIRLLNDFTIAQIINLYQWTGPKRAKHLEKKGLPAVSDNLYLTCIILLYLLTFKSNILADPGRNCI